MISIKQGIHYFIHNKAHFYDSIVKNFLGFLPDKLYLSLRYRCLMGHWIDWRNPKTFSEKLQWLKVYGFKPEYTRLVDKLAVKDYVASKIGTEYIIPTLAVWDKVEDIDWDALPNQFVLKTTHGGGGCGVVVCPDKSKLDKAKAIEKLTISMRTNAGKTYREKPYLDVPRKIIAEKFMSECNDGASPAQNGLSDYKFFCFDGEPKYCQVIRDRRSKETIDFYDMEWRHMPFVGLNPVAKNGLNPVAKNGLNPVARPLHLDEMMKICRKLSANMKFSRIDLYVINDKEYFGEITFYPAAGFGEFSPTEWNTHLGELLKLEGIPMGGVKCIFVNNKIVEIKENRSFVDNQSQEESKIQLRDYKFTCTNGIAHNVMLCYDRGTGDTKFYFFDKKWNLLRLNKRGKQAAADFTIEKPKNLDKMFEIAGKLSEGLPYARIDLYNVNGHIYFGEITFYPQSGFDSNLLPETEVEFGNLIKIKKQ